MVKDACNSLCLKHTPKSQVYVEPDNLNRLEAANLGLKYMLCFTFWENSKIFAAF